MLQISVAQLYEENRDKLGLVPAAGEALEKALIRHDAEDSAALVGHFNPIHPNRIQVLGPSEVQYFAALNNDAARQAMESLRRAPPAAIVICDGAQLPKPLLSALKEAGIPAFATALPGTEVIEALRRYLAKVLAEMTERHGVCMDVLGVGVLITGDSGVGKSELGLELISRGHGLVADDVVEIRRVAANALECRCPTMLKDFIEVRGLGLLNIRAIFGETAIRPKMNLRLIFDLEKPSPGTTLPAERLPLHDLSEEILGVTVRKVVVPVAAGRNLAVLLEAAVRNHILQLRGIYSTMEFIDRQDSAIKRDMD
jgi:HPr kinase/phosphorylase